MCPSTPPEPSHARLRARQWHRAEDVANGAERRAGGQQRAVLREGGCERRDVHATVDRFQAAPLASRIRALSSKTMRTSPSRRGESACTLNARFYLGEAEALHLRAWKDAVERGGERRIASATSFSETTGRVS